MSDKLFRFSPQKTLSFIVLKSIPTIVYYDEIWAKKKCEKLNLKRLGYSCKLLNDQSDEITPYDRKEVNS